MKKISFLLSLAILLPTLSFAAPAETAGVPPSVINFQSLKNYLRTKNYLKKKYDNGLRSWEFEPYEYTQERLQHLNVDTNKKPEFPGVEYSKLCYHWKNCVKRIYKASNGYDESYKKYSPTVTTNKGVDLAFTRNSNSAPLATDVRSGAYKLLNWSFITPKNR